MAKQADFDLSTALPIQLPPADRRAIEAEIQAHLDTVEGLIAALDEIDGDETLEDGADEEPETDTELDTADAEPSLGSLTSCALWGAAADQRGWAAGGTEDLEDEHDGRESGEDDEPSLGWTLSGFIGRDEDLEIGECPPCTEDLPPKTRRGRR
jgi:hypothetical protein